MSKRVQSVRPIEMSGGLPGLRRRRGVLRGTSMVTPVKPLMLKEGSRSERLLPKRHRLAPDHPLVQKNPEWFRPADPSDLATTRFHRTTMDRRARDLRRKTGRGPIARRGFRLPSSAPRPYRLP
ncbi:MAG: hypothetical protein ACR2G3_00610 [Solirubrobacterales bacterium]